jgi:hypothetical protein
MGQRRRTQVSRQHERDYSVPRGFDSVWPIRLAFMAMKIHSRYCQSVGFLLVLGAVVLHASAERRNTESSRADPSTISRSSDAMAPSLVSSDQGLAIIGAALESRRPTDSNADCSNLVHAIYERAGFPYPYSNSSELYRGVKEFRRVLHPQPGDLVVWRGHVGIVISPVRHSFFSAMRSGRGVEFYDSRYWQMRGRPRFLRYLKASSRTQFTASTRNANLRRRIPRIAESHDPVPADQDSADQDSADQDFAPVAGVPSSGQASGTLRAATVAPARVSRTDPPGALPEIEGQPAASLHKSDGQTISDAPRAMDANKPRPASHNIQGPGDGVWEKTAAKPSPAIPFGSVVTPTRPYQPRPPQGFRTSSTAAHAGQAGATPPSASGPPVPMNEPRSEPLQWAMSRYVPRPPWSLNGGRTSESSIPRPPATQGLRPLVGR